MKASKEIIQAVEDEKQIREYVSSLIKAVCTQTMKEWGSVQDFIEPADYLGVTEKQPYRTREQYLDTLQEQRTGDETV